ncbi:glycosyltransferase [Granulicella arctica]|uniref:glycosyltransferase n=1 Tax=Granulicella arctica TaxID=940613 RepID=UPI0021DF8E61|nr:glycosyltransferase [Granulicella arctica]
MPPLLIQCVVVLYECSLEESRTLNSLATVWRKDSGLAKQIALLIYDNSPHPQHFDLGGFECGIIEYRRALTNGGLVPAYNEALVSARKREINWLLLLDQDTTIHSDLLPALLAAIKSPPDDDVFAIVPKLLQQGHLISPQIVGKFRNYDYPVTMSGVSQKHLTALNSATCLRVEAVTALGGFPGVYWLDFLDHVMFHRLNTAHGRTLVLDVGIEHRLSIKSIENEMSLHRYTNVLAAEWRFVRETGWGNGTLTHRLRLLKRALNYALTLTDKAYAAKTLRAAFAW